MKQSRSQSDMAYASELSEDFSLVVGGPLYQLLLRARLVRPQLELVRRRMLVLSVVAWLPLLALSLLEGHVLGGVALPFLRDYEAHARFLVALPILLAAELLVHQKMRSIIGQFRERGVVPAASQPQFSAALASAARLRSSLVVEVVLLVLVFVLGPLAWEHGLALETDTWYAAVDGGHLHPTVAGWWFFCVSAPIFQFLLLRWYFRMAIWWRLAWQLAHLPLELTGLHPDRAGGIGFLGGSLIAFAPVVFAQSVVVAGIMFTRVLTGADRAIDFRGEVGLLLAFLVAQVVVPLLFFAPALIAVRERTLRNVGRYASTYARGLDRKWLKGEASTDDVPLDHAIKSLTNLAGSDDIVREMRLAPFNLRMLLRLVAVVAIPFVPLLLSAVPFGELVQDLMKALL